MSVLGIIAFLTLLYWLYTTFDVQKPPIDLSGAKG